MRSRTHGQGDLTALDARILRTLIGLIEVHAAPDGGVSDRLRQRLDALERRVFGTQP